MSVNQHHGSPEKSFYFIFKACKSSFWDKVYNHEQILAGLLGVGGRLTVTFLVAEESPLSL
jgi:hypothetical protein